MMDERESSGIQRLIELQREANELMQKMTPTERAFAAREALRHMPGQAYLFATEGADHGDQG